MVEINSVYPEDKIMMYELLISQVETLVGDSTLVISDLANVSALLNEALPNLNWVGFYLLKDNLLHLGPFQGKLACTKIPVGKGVCGTAVQEKKTQLVKNVHEFPGHIACDSASNSEIVVPITVNNTVIAVLDIDSPMLSRFDETDKVNLEHIIRIIEAKCNWDTYKV